MDRTSGRHRQGGRAGLITAGVLIALGLGFLGGLATDRFVLSSSGGGTQAGPTASAAAPSSMTAPDPPSSADADPAATGAAAPADPAPPGPQGARAYLARLADDGLPVDEHRDALLVLGNGVCQAVPAVRADPEVMGERITEVVGDLLTPEQATRLAEVAATELCGG